MLRDDAFAVACPTVAQLMAEWADEIDAMLVGLADGDLMSPDRPSPGNSIAIITGTPYAWSEATAGLTRLQSRAIDRYRRFLEVLRVLLRHQSDARRKQLEDDAAGVERLIQRRRSPFSEPAKALEHARAALRRQASLVDLVFGDSDGLLLIPDTNALYWNPALDTWRLPANCTFGIVLTPTVLREIDRHRAGERSTNRRAKAERLAGQIKEYRRRGSLLDGVTLARDVSRISWFPTEPSIGDSLSWLDPLNEDHRLIATAIEVMRRNVQSAVIVVTRDLHLQSQLEFAGIPCADPSTFVAEAT